MYDSILMSLREEAFRSRIKTHCTDIVDILRFGSLDDFRIICPSYLGNLKKECEKNKINN